MKEYPQLLLTFNRMEEMGSLDALCEKRGHVEYSASNIKGSLVEKAQTLVFVCHPLVQPRHYALFTCEHCESDATVLKTLQP